ncbi:MAG: Gfo/Idh/MocA family oxidoreductase [Verrucomicrobiales bacterium]|jgi:predicted dehydrogenase|nr:Gfo/Idh/MocA family oxidoreductase [Verrucomicrobiales bacterium]
MDAKLNFALVGCGRVSENHLKTLTSPAMPTRLVAVADCDAARARAKGEKYGVPHYADYHEMLARHPETQVINIAAPTGYHAGLVCDLARHGKHLVTEKPMALTVGDCDRMLAVCRARGCRLFVVKQNRFNPAVIAARRAYDEGRFGKIVMVTARVRWRRDDAYYTDGWHGTWSLDGGVMSQQASHHLDLLQWFLGDITGVQCQTATRLLNMEAEDTAAALLKGANGALGVFEATVAARPENIEGSLSIMGERGTVIIGGIAVNHIQYWKFEDHRAEDDHWPARASENVSHVYGSGHGPYLRNVVEAIVSGKPALVEGDEGRKDIAILTALYESAATDGALLAPGCAINHSRLGRR